MALLIGAVAAGRLVGRIGTRPFAVVGLALVAIGNALLIGVSAGGNVYAEALPGITVFALGGGPLFVCATTSALGRIGLHEVGLVSVSSAPSINSVPPSVLRWPPPSPPWVSPARPRSRGSPTPTPCSPSSPPWPRWSRSAWYRPECHK